MISGHGVRGLARVKPYNPGSPALASSAELWLRRAGDEAPTRFEVAESRPYKRIFLIGFTGIDSLTALEPWFKSEVSVDPDSLPPPTEEELYDFEAIGLEVRTTDGTPVGKIREVMPLPASDVWVVDSPGEPAREILIPATEPILKEIDLTGGYAVIDPPAGLLDDE